MSDSGGTGTPGTPPGWYPDGQGGQRWWDGVQWGPVGGPPAEEHPTTAMPTTAMPTSPPPTGPPPAYPPPGQSAAGAEADAGGPARTKLLLGILGGLVGVAVLVVILVLALGGDDGPADDPVETVERFFDAARDNDCEAAVDLLTEDARTTFAAGDCESADPTEDFEAATVDIGEAVVDGTQATVPVTVQDEAGDLGPVEIPVDFELVEQDGVWLIDGFAFGLDDLPESPFSDLPSDFDPEEFLSDLPSDFLSDLPSDFLSDLPSELPSDLLSDLPSDFLSDLPSDFLSDLPSDFLSDLPSDFLSDFDLEEFLSDLPTDAPSDLPSE